MIQKVFLAGVIQGVFNKKVSVRENKIDEQIIIFIWILTEGIILFSLPNLKLLYTKKNQNMFS